MKEPKFNILDKVYHICSDSPQGIILDIMYYYRSKSFSYLVSWGHDSNSTVWEEELSNTKNLVY